MYVDCIRRHNDQPRECSAAKCSLLGLTLLDTYPLQSNGWDMSILRVREDLNLMIHWYSIYAAMDDRNRRLQAPRFVFEHICLSTKERTIITSSIGCKGFIFTKKHQILCMIIVEKDGKAKILFIQPDSKHIVFDQLDYDCHGFYDDGDHVATFSKKNNAVMFINPLNGDLIRQVALPVKLVDNFQFDLWFWMESKIVLHSRMDDEDSTDMMLFDNSGKELDYEVFKGCHPVERCIANIFAHASEVTQETR